MPKEPPRLYGPKRSRSNASKASKKRTSPKKKKRRRISFQGLITRLFFMFCIWGVCLGGIAVMWFSYDLPSVSSLKMPARKANVTILTQEGEVLSTYGDLYEDLITVDQLPPSMIQALLATEDRRFYYHFGVDVIGLIRAAYANYKADRIVQGGSTITQQLAKNFLQTQGIYKISDRSIRRKVQEVLMALWLEWTFTKDEILTIYLNRVYFGAGTYGVDAASRRYFNKSARQLSVYESAMVAGLLQAPSRYSPISHPKRARKRTITVLTKMVDAGYIKTIEPYLKDSNKKQEESSSDHTKDSKYFADWVYETIPNYVNTKSKDLVVVTTLDSSMQKHAEAAVQKTLDENSKQYKVKQGALIAMTPDGAVRAMVGGRSYRQSQYNRTLARRQAGSIFKIAVYLAAFEAGWHPQDMIEDTEIEFGRWKPKNYKWEERGELSLQDAFAYSVNTSAIRLAQDVGVGRVKSVARRLGVTSKMPHNLTIALGTAEVTLLELTSMYATFANQGYSVWPYAILEIRDKEGNILYQRKQPKTNRIIQDRELAYMHKVMFAQTDYGYGRGSKKSGKPAAGKTGSNGDIDAWFVGYTPTKGLIDNNRSKTTALVVGTWFGNDRNESMNKRSTGGRLPLWTWSEFIKNALADKKVGSFKEIVPEYEEEFSFFRQRQGDVEVAQSAMAEALSEGNSGSQNTPTVEARQGLQSLIERAASN